ncbi:SURF1 family cytochrome oxidase biogenesis protein, partial [Gordonia sp. GAMMA]|uniref:SURF1 family protein n=1 Tax=Gordonia sp. GAMMA TaxID=2502241 RepID=UPI0024C2163D
MHVLRTILRPGWIALGLVVAAFAVACFTLLAPWQLGKNSDTERRNDLIRTATSIETAPLAEVAPSSTFVPSSEWRSVAVTGRYLTDRQALVRLRNVDQRPAVEVLTPFAVSGSDRVILVNRGFVRPVEGAVPDIPAPPVGEQTVDGRGRDVGD